MIYISDDYLTKYIDTLGYIFARSIKEGYSLLHIEKVISYSQAIEELEKSNVTSIAFSSPEMLYSKMFPDSNNLDRFEYSPYDIFGWLGFVYIHLFLKYQITFELMFFVLPIEKALSLYKLYHETDIQMMYELFEQSVEHSYFDQILKYKNMSSNELSRLTGISFATIQSLRYKKRDINKAEIKILLKISIALNIKITSLIDSLELSIG